MSGARGRFGRLPDVESQRDLQPSLGSTAISASNGNTGDQRDGLHLAVLVAPLRAALRRRLPEWPCEERNRLRLTSKALVNPVRQQRLNELAGGRVMFLFLLVLLCDGLAIYCLGKWLWGSIQANSGWLSLSAWQGIAGIAQIGAALLSTYTIIIAKRQQRESVDPDWELVHAYARPNPGGNPYGTIQLLNTGFGPARQVAADFAPANGHAMPKVSAGGSRAGAKIVPAGELGNVFLSWDPGRQVDGVLTLTCVSRFAHKVTRAYHVCSYVDSSGLLQLKVDPVRR